MKIGMFDSGIGGISLLHKAINLLPNEQFIYYADTDNAPYGIRSLDEVVSLSERAVNFLYAQGCSVVVIACNTATSAAISKLRASFPIPIIGIEPAVKPAVENAVKRILVTATPLTIKEKKLSDLIDRFDTDHRVDCLALPKLVSFAEQYDFSSDSVRKYISDELSSYSPEDYSHLVLGCTHFCFFRPIFESIFRGVEIIDGNNGTAVNIYNTVKKIRLGILADNSIAQSQDGKIRTNVRGNVSYYISTRPASADFIEKTDYLFSILK